VRRLLPPVPAALLILTILAAPRPRPAQAQTTGSILVMAAGDISPEPGVDRTDDVATFQILAAANPSVVLTLGDNQYENGTYAKYASLSGYAGSWGRMLSRTRPSPGNHEYYDPGVAPNGQGMPGYLTYFASRLTGLPCQSASPPCRPDLGYYSFDLANGWHVVSLNSDCGYSDGTSPRCGTSDPMLVWLRADLAAHAAQRCTLSYWHVERYGSHAPFEDNTLVTTLWSTLNNAGADLNLVGHSHAYARLGAMDNAGHLAAGSNGMRQITVGTGGKDLSVFDQPAREGTRYRDNLHFGVLRLRLDPGGWSSLFNRTDGVRSDPTGVYQLNGSPVGCR
jgi:acid phosphatase type 7